MSATGAYVSKDSKTAEKFTLFPKLPTECRLQIWNEAFSVPQQIAFSVVQTPFSSNKAFLKRLSPINSLLHVCRESREEFLAVYLKNGNPLNLNQMATEDAWDVWRYFRFGVDICEIRNDTRVPWTFLVRALAGRESYGLELVMGQREIAAR